MEKVIQRLIKDINDLDNEIIKLQREQSKFGDNRNYKTIKELNELRENLAWDLALLETEEDTEIKIDKTEELKKTLYKIANYLNEVTYNVFQKEEIEQFVTEYSEKCKTKQGVQDIIDTLKDEYKINNDIRAIWLSIEFKKHLPLI